MLNLPLEDNQDMPLYHALGVLDNFYSRALGQWLISRKAKARAHRSVVGMAGGCLFLGPHLEDHHSLSTFY